MALFRVSLGVLGVIIALMVAGFILMKVRTDAVLTPKGTPASLQGEGSDSGGK